jgi:hypothetical protein
MPPGSRSGVFSHVTSNRISPFYIPSRIHRIAIWQLKDRRKIGATFGADSNIVSLV